LEWGEEDGKGGREKYPKVTADIAVAGWCSNRKELIVAAAVQISERTISQKGEDV